jgi:hypothetical protein
MTTIDHGFNLAAIRAELDRSDWEDDFENPGSQVRQTYLGTVFNLTPSGKYYLPFACSNVSPCESCHGTGHVVPRRLKRRTLKRQASRHLRVMRRFDALWGDAAATYPIGPEEDGQPMPSLGRPYRPTNKRAAFAYIDRQPRKYRMRYFTMGSTCTACGGLGSREAYLDELWREAAEAALETIGCSLTGGEGDPCDMFAAEYRDAPEEDAEDEAEGSADDATA